jgi:hypothetical protein
MDDALIRAFLVELSRVVRPHGHALFWVDKYILLTQLLRCSKASSCAWWI